MIFAHTKETLEELDPNGYYHVVYDNARGIIASVEYDMDECLCDFVYEHGKSMPIKYEDVLNIFGYETDFHRGAHKCYFHDKKGDGVAILNEKGEQVAYMNPEKRERLGNRDLLEQLCVDYSHHDEEEKKLNDKCNTPSSIANHVSTIIARAEYDHDADFNLKCSEIRNLEFMHRLIYLSGILYSGNVTNKNDITHCKFIIRSKDKCGGFLRVTVFDDGHYKVESCFRFNLPPVSTIEVKRDIFSVYFYEHVITEAWSAVLHAERNSHCMGDIKDYYSTAAMPA